MIEREYLRNKIFSVASPDFDDLALELFNYQYYYNEVYRDYCHLLQKSPGQISSIEQIPFLPIEFFRTHKVTTGVFIEENVFQSSTTTEQTPSNHFVRELDLYEESFSKCFEYFFGLPEQYCILALLPSYLERNNSSLVFMADKLIKKSKHPKSGFFLNDYKALHQTILGLEKNQQQIILLGVSFALLDFAKQFPAQFRHTIIMETGGMKGRREEMTREELHSQLEKAFFVTNIYSEYGMTELLSQAYSKGEGKFFTAPWMKVLIRETYDPFQWAGNEVTGGINIIDLANIDSCSFIATSDLGKTYGDNSFEVLGRMDYSDIRGCNLMLE